MPPGEVCAQSPQAWNSACGLSQASWQVGPHEPRQHGPAAPPGLPEPPPPPTALPGGAGKLLTRMLGSLSECLARAMASSVTLVSPLAWISSTAIWRRGQEVRPRGLTAQDRGVQGARRRPGQEAVGPVPPTHTCRRRRCPLRCGRPPLKEGRRVSPARRAEAVLGAGPPGLTAILRGEEVQVPRFLLLGVDGASEIIRQR